MERGGRAIADINEITATAPNLMTLDAMTKCKQVIDSHKNIVVSISGGADSDIMLDLIERVGHRGNVQYVFFDTGIEYEATKQHLDYLEQRYGIEIHREKAVVPVPSGCKAYGLPFLTKNVSERIDLLQRNGFQWEDEPFDTLAQRYSNCVSGLKWWCNAYEIVRQGQKSSFNINRHRLLKEFMIANPPTFRISKKCCDGAKKKTGNGYNKKVKADACCVGIRRAEGGIRSVSVSTCVTWGDDRKITAYRPLFWFSDKDKAEYEDAYNICHSACYTEYGLPRTGCACCPYGSNFENELLVTKQHEPKLYKAAQHIFGKSYEYTRKYREFKANYRKEDEL